jgi:hypothetical protein
MGVDPTGITNKSWMMLRVLQILVAGVDITDISGRLWELALTVHASPVQTLFFFEKT